MSKYFVILILTVLSALSMHNEPLIAEVKSLKPSKPVVYAPLYDNEKREISAWQISCLDPEFYLWKYGFKHGDVIVKINDTQCAGRVSLSDLLEFLTPDSGAIIKVKRKGKEISLIMKKQIQKRR